jgi:hypothetical protein
VLCNINISYEYYINFIIAKGLKMDMKYFIIVADVAGDQLDIREGTRFSLQDYLTIIKWTR